MNTYIKLRDIDSFTVEKYIGSKYSRWNGGAWENSDIPKPGFMIQYGVQTPKGILTLSKTQMGNVLEASGLENGIADINGKTFHVTKKEKRFMKNGQEIVSYNYFFDLDKGASNKEEEVDITDLPF